MNMQVLPQVTKKDENNMLINSNYRVIQIAGGAAATGGDSQAPPRRGAAAHSASPLGRRQELARHAAVPAPPGRRSLGAESRSGSSVVCLSHVA